LRGGAQETLRGEIARRIDGAGRRHGERYPRQRRIPRTPHRRVGAPRGGGGGLTDQERGSVNPSSGGGDRRARTAESLTPECGPHLRSWQDKRGGERL